MARVPVFELHIRPMFRLLDREHMMKWVESFDLWSVEAVWQERHSILDRIKIRNDMPGERYGGPYPGEWISVFERWMATGTDTQLGHHLVLATAESGYTVQSVGGDKRRLSVRVTAPTAGCRCWFELESVTPDERRYTLYLEPAYPTAAPSPTPLDAREPFVKSGTARLVIRDASGEQVVAIP